MKHISSLVLILFMLTSCLNGEQQTPNALVFDLETYAQKLKSQNHSFSNVQLISDNGIIRDTINYSEFKVDSIVPLMLSFDFSRRERASEFEINENKSDGFTCKRYSLKKPSDIEHLTVCQQADQVMRISGRKQNNSLLGALKQSYQFEINSGFELNSIYIDKVTKDTLATSSSLFWTLKK